MSNKVVVGIFSYVDDTYKAIEELKGAGLKKIQVLSPVPLNETKLALAKDSNENIMNFSINKIFAAIKDRDFHVIRIAASGSIFTFLALIGLALSTFIELPIQQGGLPIIPMPFLLLVGAVGAMLGGVIFSTVGFLFLARLPKYDLGIYEKSVSNDKFAIILKNYSAEKQNIAKEILQKSGADKVEEAQSSS